MKNKSIYLLPLLLITAGQWLLKPAISANALSAQAIDVTNTSVQEVRDYYASLNSMSDAERQGQSLLTNLKPILKKNHASFSYATVWDWTRITDRDWELSPLSDQQLASYAFNDNPYVHLLYRADNGTATASRHNDTHGSVIDREHVWPKSLGNFGESAPAGTDLHHLILADSKNNQSGHNNNPYGNVNPSSYTPIEDYNGNATGKRGNITFNGKSYTVYEPQDSDKGDIARAMFYMAARYSSYTNSSDPYLLLSDTPHTTTTTSSATTPGQGGLLSTLLEWHTLDPVDNYEIRRNNLIYNNAQFNRNPFIDYPSWVDAVWGSKAPANPTSDRVTQYGQIESVAPSTMTLSPNSHTLALNQTVPLKVSVTPLNADNSVIWTSSNPQVASVSNGVVTALSAGQTTITATSTLDSDISATATITVSNVVISLTSLSVSGVTSTIKYGESYPLDQIKVTAHYSDLSTIDVTSKALIPLPDTSKLGPQNLVISYSDNGITKTIPFNIQVTNKDLPVGIQPLIATDLFISEYVEGSSNNKYVEIFNGTGSNVNLANYKLRLYSNGSSTPGKDIALSGTLNQGAVAMYMNSGAALTIQNGTASANTAVNFNGNDAVALFSVAKGDNIDVIGTIGEDPGTAWTGQAINGNASTLDNTLVRASFINSPTTEFKWSEWLVSAKDTATYLGSHTMDSETIAITAETQAKAWADYFLEATSIYCENLNGDGLLGSIWNDLAAEYNYMANDTKAIFATTEGNADAEGVAGAKARYYYLITKYQSLHENNFMRDGNDQIIYQLPFARTNGLDFNHKAVAISTLSILTLLGFILIRRKHKKTA